MSITVEQFVERLTESGLLSAAEVSTIQEGLPPEKRPKDVQQLAQVLVQQGKLTKYQAQAVYQGKTKGLVFGQYVVLDKLGEGGMGVVLKARHRRMDRTVAIKVLSSTAMKRPEAIDRFQREVRAAAKLSHPNIVTAYDADEYQGMHCLVMEYVEGHDLATIVKDHGPLEVREAVDCILQAARGLQYAHSKGIVHRDIKPGNLLLDKEGTVKILDMGLALIAGADVAPAGPERLTNTGQVMGTCDYMAPEQALDTHAADHRADIYALGCTLYRLLTGKPPYEGETLIQILLAHRESPIPSLCEARPEVPADLDACFQRMVAKEPEDRQQSMAEVVAELEAVLAVLSGQSVPAAASADSPSVALSRSLAFLEEDTPRGPLTRQKQSAADQHTLPHLGSEYDTGSNIFGKARVAVATVRRKPLLLLGLAGGLVLLLGITLVLTLRHGTLLIEIDERLGKDVQVVVSQGGEKVQLVDSKSGWTISLSPGKYDLAVEGGDDQFQLDSHTITVTRGGQVKAKVTLKPPPLAVAPFDAALARKHQQRWARYLGVPVEMTNAIGMKLVLIPPGEFTMGEGGDAHKVRITKPFYLGKYEVTQEEWEAVAGKGNNPSQFRGPRNPVERVSWDDCQAFLEGLGPMCGATGGSYRLPTEAQWEYACRAGSTGGWCFGDAESELDDYGRYRKNSEGKTHPVGEKKPSPWGLFDVHGNVWQWCADWHDKDYYKASPGSDPTGPPSGLERVYRGGSWNSPARDCRSACRYTGAPGIRNNNLGFRASLVMADTAAERAKIATAPETARPSGDSTASKPSPGAIGGLSASAGGGPRSVAAETPAPVAASPGPKEEPKPEVPKPAPVSKPPEPKTQEETKVAPKEAKTAEVKPAPKGSAEKPKPDEEQAPAKKLDLPSADEQKRLIREIDEVYKPGEANGQAAQVALARKLLEDGRKDKAKRAEQFVLLRRAGEIAGEAGEPDLMLEAVDAIAAAGFNIQPFQVKARFLEQLVKQGPSGDAYGLSIFGESCMKFAEEAAASGAMDEASDVLGAARHALTESRKRAQTADHTARAAMARTGDPAWQKKLKAAEVALGEIDYSLAALAECAKGLQRARHEHEAIQSAQERLKTEPDEPDACLAVGRWLCFSKGDWDEGLKLLAKGSDGSLKSLAAKELASKLSKAEERVARGDAWWDLAEKTTGKAKAAMRRRAGHWYQEAMPDLTPGLERSTVEGRLAQGAEEPLPGAEGGFSRVRPPLTVAPFSEKAARMHQARWAMYLRVPVVQTNSIGMKMVLIPPGEFEMGSPKELIEEELKTAEDWSKRFLSGEGPQHRVRITKPFYLGMHDVTQEEYERVMGKNPSVFSASGGEKGKVAGQDTKRFPVENVSWNDAVEFCRRLSALTVERAVNRRYILPTEAQWEHACRAGNAGRFSFSSGGRGTSREEEERELSDYGWFLGNSGGRTHTVGGKRASAWGLYDMHGNVWEWCEDWYGKDYYANSATDDPAGPLGGSSRVDRGGCWEQAARHCRSARRDYREPEIWDNRQGFRVARVVVE